MEFVSIAAGFKGRLSDSEVLAVKGKELEGGRKCVLKKKKSGTPPPDVNSSAEPVDIVSQGFLEAPKTVMLSALFPPGLTSTY